MCRWLKIKCKVFLLQNRCTYVTLIVWTNSFTTSYVTIYYHELMWSVFNRLRASQWHRLPAPPARATQHARSGQVRPHQSGSECGGWRPRQRTRGVHHNNTAVGSLRGHAGPVIPSTPANGAPSLLRDSFRLQDHHSTRSGGSGN